jgi:hypothetical protein
MTSLPVTHEHPSDPLSDPKSEHESGARGFCSTCYQDIAAKPLFREGLKGLYCSEKCIKEKETTI